MSDRLADGFKLYQKGYVTFKGETNGLYEFEVMGTKPKKGDRPVYYVTCKDGVWYCNQCWDYATKWDEYTGSFNCKHIHACMFKMAEIKGINQQKTIELPRDFITSG